MAFKRPKRSITFKYYIIINLTIFCFIFVGLEATARLVFPGEDKLGKILSILEQDPELLWRQKPNLKVRFQGVEVETNFLGLRGEISRYEKTKDTFRIICLGASPTFGWAVKCEDTYSSQLEKMLEDKSGEGEVYEVINAGIVGYTSYQGLILLQKEILKFHPDIITASYIVNDIDRDRFYRSNGKSDQELKPKNPYLIKVENLLEKSKFFRIWKRLVFRAQEAVAKSSEIKESNDLGAVRVSPQQYRNNLNAIIDVARGSGIKVVLIKMSVNLSLQDTDMSQERKIQALQCKEDIQAYNQIMEEVAKRNEVPLVDTELAFAKSKDKMVFATAIHPNAIGHKMIAVEIYSTLLNYDLLSSSEKD